MGAGNVFIAWVSRFFLAPFNITVSGWKVEARGFKLSDDALHELFGLSKRDSFLLDLLYGYS